MSALPVPVQVTWAVTASGQPVDATPATPLQVQVAQVHLGLTGERGLQGLRGIQGEKGDAGDAGPTGDVTPAALAARTAAEDARDEAGTHAGAAGVQAVLSTTKAAEAVAAAALASTARDAAFVNAQVYASVATGLAAVADGVQFQVVSADGMTISRYRRDSSVLSTLMASYPSAASFRPLSERSGYLSGAVSASGLLLMGFAESDGRPIFGFGGDVVSRIQGLELIAPQQGYGRGGFLHALLTPAGRKIVHTDDETGRFFVWGRDILAEIEAAAASQTAVNLIVPGQNILALGDSLTAGGASWAGGIAASLSGAREVTNLAVGGQKSSHQAGRLGVVPFLLTFQNNTILSAGSSVVQASQQLLSDGVTLQTVHPITSQGNTWRARVAGVLGAFSSATYDGSGFPTALVFTPDPGQIVADKKVDAMVPTESVWATGKEMNLLLVGIGRNNASEFDIVRRDLLAIRDRWQPTSQKRMIVVTPPPRWKHPVEGTLYGEGSAGAGAATWGQLVAIERWCQANFGEFCIVSRQALMRGASGSADDIEAVANGSVPPSLTSDGLHWNAAGHTIIREAVAALINRKGF